MPKPLSSIISCLSCSLIVILILPFSRLDSNFSYGISTKFIYSGIQERSSTALAFDLGLLYEFPADGWSFGLSALNLGNQLTTYYDSKEDLPVDIRLGFAKQFEKVPLKLFFSFNRLNDNANDFAARFKNYTFGGEIKLSKALRARLGYNNQIRKDLKIGTTSGLAGVNLGFGITISTYLIDYSFSSLGPVGSLHRFGISTNL